MARKQADSASPDTSRSRNRLILASASPRRLQLLEQAGIRPDDVSPTEIDERPLDGERPIAMVRRLAREKAEAARVTDAGTFVLAADTIVAVGKRILGKATDEAGARRHLMLLSGRKHTVITGIALITPAGDLLVRSVTTTVTFKRLSREELDWYIASGEWRGKAGSYAIQGRAGAFVTGIAGSYSNVVGLPLNETVCLLEGNGYLERLRSGDSTGGV